MVLNKELVILKQDKRRGIVLLDRLKYTKRYFSIINSKQLKKFGDNPTTSSESKIQRTIRKLKSKFTTQEYNNLHPTSSNSGKFYGTAKIHKLRKLGTVDDLPLQPIVSNIGVVSYHLAKYLTKLLSPLCKSQYTVESPKDFISFIKTQKILSNHQLVSFDAVLLFTNVPFDFTIAIIVKRIYKNRAI